MDMFNVLIFSLEGKHPHSRWVRVPNMIEPLKEEKHLSWWSWVSFYPPTSAASGSGFFFSRVTWRKPMSCDMFKAVVLASLSNKSKYICQNQALLRAPQLNFTKKTNVPSRPKRNYQNLCSKYKKNSPQTFITHAKCWTPTDFWREW